MKKYIFAALILCGCINIQCDARGPKVDSSADSTSTERVGEGTPAANDIPDGARRLMAAYPDFISGYADGQLVMTDGTKMVYDDGREKSFEQKLDEADPEDMFAFTYDRSDKEPEYLQDAGRSRCEPLFKKMYGNSESQVRTHLIKVPWFGEQVLFTDVNGAADSLRAVAADIAAQPNFAQLKQYLKSSGTFYWRKVRGANRQSAHSYGMTIDIGVNVSDYWLWKNPGKKETDRIIYANRFPHELVHIFERHGFIWGGRWYHYDTMHFEYRPEFLVP
jgi:hypothetical protein